LLRPAKSIPMRSSAGQGSRFGPSKIRILDARLKVCQGGYAAPGRR
jgi:hypothetical protein